MRGTDPGLVIPVKVAAHEGIVAVAQPLGMKMATAASVGDTLGGPLARCETRVLGRQPAGVARHHHGGADPCGLVVTAGFPASVATNLTSR
ncbi:hypothetical protein [Nocardia sputorum]|uniref:hypothetical protein n=1 Tax=Nocardia sputorum TaxID=2984338 RepID=UPI00248FBEDD|nr:hypothetical protein [Nocardia sputorum]